jgi:hypothetical protein
MEFYYSADQQIESDDGFSDRLDNKAKTALKAETKINV